MTKDDKINLKLEVYKDKNSGKLTLLAHFDKSAPNVYKEKENFVWMPTDEEKNFLNEAFEILPQGTTVPPVKEDTDSKQDTPLFQVGDVGEAGQEVLLIGIPFDEETSTSSPKYSIGKIKKVVQSTGTGQLYFINARTDEGWSGGPVIDLESGEVLAVISGEWVFPPHQYTVAWAISGVHDHVSTYPTPEPPP